MNVPIYQTIFPGGDTQGVFNLSPHPDHWAGDARSVRRRRRESNFPSQPADDQFRPGDPAERTLSLGGFHLAGDPEHFYTGHMMSTGLELQVLMPVVNAPFRVYWAYNPLRVNTNLLPPQVAGPTYFPNQATYQNYLNTYPAIIPFSDKPSLFKFSIGRTF